MTITPIAPVPFDDLEDRISGHVISPTDVRYEDACRAWNLSYHHRPALVVVPDTAEDVSMAVQYAVARNLPITVQSTGHGVITPAEDSVLVLTHHLNDVRIDPIARTALIGGGAKWDRVLGPAQAAGLAPLLGSTPDVGAVGYTLGGGMGWLGRKYGLSIDRVRAFEIVTADGAIRLVSDDVEPELFWALCGGGAGSLGIVTAMQIELVPVTEVYAGNLFYRPSELLDVAEHYRRWIEDAPDELTSSIALMNFPPFDEVPEFLRGQSFVIIRGCYTGDLSAGAAMLDHWRSWRTPEFDLWGPLMFSEAATISNDPVDPLGGLSTTEWLRDIDDHLFAELGRGVFPTDGPPVLVVAEIRHAGGAISRPTRSRSYGNRDQTHLLQIIGVSEDDESHGRLEQHVESLRSEISVHTTGTAYLNFLEGGEKVRRARQGFDGESWQRLRRVKASVDPTNIFRDGLPLA